MVDESLLESSLAHDFLYVFFPKVYHEFSNHFFISGAAPCKKLAPSQKLEHQKIVVLEDLSCAHPQIPPPKTLTVRTKK
jgi:hypothetical protein